MVSIFHYRDQFFVLKEERWAAKLTFEKLADRYNTYEELAEDLMNELHKNRLDVNWKEVVQFIFNKVNEQGKL